VGDEFDLEPTQQMKEFA